MSIARPVRALMAGFVVTSVLLLASVPAAAGTTSGITLDVTLGSGCIEGQAGASEAITVSVKTPGGQLRGRETTQTGPDGSFDACPLSITGVQGADVVLAHDATSSRSWQVPDIGARSDRVTDRITGHAPPGTGMSLTVTRSPLGQIGNGQGRIIAAAAFIVGSSGEYGLDVPDNLLGGDVIVVHAYFGSDTLTAQSFVPFVLVTAGDNLIEGATNPGEPVTLDLRAPTGTSRAHLVATPFLQGIFLATFEGSDGQAIYPRADDRLHASIGGGVTLRIPRTALRADASSDVVKGRCMPGARFRVEVSRFAFPNPPADAAMHGTTSSDGTFHVDFTGRLNVKAGDDLQLVCQYHAGDLLIVNSSVLPTS